MVMGEQTAASTSPILELRGISKSFHGTKVLDGVDFAVRSGEVMALMG
jgi:ABC-type sugar transport system ATPase subunit